MVYNEDMIKYGEFKRLYDLSENYSSENEFFEHGKSDLKIDPVELEDMRPGRATDEQRVRWLLSTIWKMSHTSRDIIFQNIPLNNEEKTKYFGMDLRTIKSMMYEKTQKNSHQTSFLLYILLNDFLWDRMRPLVTEKMSVAQMHKLQKEYKKEQNI